MESLGEGGKFYFMIDFRNQGDLKKRIFLLLKILNPVPANHPLANRPDQAVDLDHVHPLMPKLVQKPIDGQNGLTPPIV